MDLWTIRYRALEMSAGEVFEVQALEPSKALTDFLGSHREEVAEIRQQPEVSLILTNGCILKFTKTIDKRLLRREVERVRFLSPNYADVSAPQSDAVKRIQELTGWNLKQTRAFVSKVYRDNDLIHRREKKMLDAARKKLAKVKGSLTRSGRGTAS